MKGGEEVGGEKEEGKTDGHSRLFQHIYRMKQWNKKSKVLEKEDNWW